MAFGEVAREGPRLAQATCSPSSLIPLLSLSGSHLDPHRALPLSRKQLWFAEGSALPHTQGHGQALDGAALGPVPHPSACPGAHPWPAGGHSGGDKGQTSGFSLPGAKALSPKEAS